MKGKWRIVSMAMWDKDFLDMIETVHISFDGEDAGQFTFGCITGSMSMALCFFFCAKQRPEE